MPDQQPRRWQDERLNILVVNGVEGPSLYINDYRVAGNKPWGGGTTFHEWRGATVADLLKAVKPLAALEADLQAAREALERIDAVGVVSVDDELHQVRRVRRDPRPHPS